MEAKPRQDCPHVIDFTCGHALQAAEKVQEFTRGFRQCVVLRGAVGGELAVGSSLCSSLGM